MTSRRRIIVLIVAVVAIALVAVASVLMSQDQDQPDSSAATTPTTPAETSEYGFPISHIRLGEGGTKTAPDGKTPIGYTASCDDAAQAAVNYVAARSSSPSGWKKQGSTMTQIFSQSSDSEDLIQAAKALANEYGASTTYKLLSPGLFQVENCDAGQSATIHIPVRVHQSEFKLDGKTSSATTNVYFSVHRLLWENNDWKLDPAPATDKAFSDHQLQYTPPKSEPAQPKDIINELFVDTQGNPLSREGWFQLSQ